MKKNVNQFKILTMNISDYSEESLDKLWDIVDSYFN